MDSINSGAYAEMVKAIKKREEWFNKEITNFKKSEQALIKRIEKLDAPKEDE